MTSATIGNDSRSRFGIGLATVIALGFAYRLVNIVNADSAFYVYAAQKLLAGGSYPGQIYDINPPLIVLLSAPPALLAQHLPLSLPVAFTVYIFALFGLSLWMILKLVPLQFNEAPNLAAIALLAWAIFELILPGYHFGQREHIATIAAAPYLCLVARRWNGIPSSRTVEIACASFCAVALLLKPTLLALPLAILLVDIVRDRSLRRIFAAENLAFAGWTLAYAALLWVAFPGYLQIAADGVQTYSHYEMPVQIVGRPVVRILLAGGFCVVIASLLGAGSMLMGLIWLCAIAIAVTSLHVLLQMKGWSYHVLPAWIALALMSTLVAALALRWLKESRNRWPTALVLLACLAVAGLEPLARTLAYSYDNSVMALAREPLFARLRNDMRGNNVMAFATATGPEGIALHAGAGWGSRFLAYLELPFVTDKLANPTGLSPAQAERVARLDRTMKTATAEDIRLFRPKFIFVEITPEMQGMRGRQINLLDYFRQDVDVARELANYDVYAGTPNGVLNYGRRQFVVLQRRNG